MNSKTYLFIAFHLLTIGFFNSSFSFAKDIPAPELIVSTGASSCSSVDHRSELPPVRDQGSLGWCYAYTAADLLSFELGVNISPIDVALSYNHELNIEAFRTSWQRTRGWLNRFMLVSDDATPLKGTRPLVEIVNNLILSYSPESLRDAGWTSRSIQAAQERGLCSEEDLSLADESEVELVRLIADYRALYRSFEEYSQTNVETSLPDYICTLNKHPFSELIETLGLDLISSAIENRINQDLFFHLANNLCENRRTASFEPVNERLYEASEEQRINRINEVLDTGSILGIAYSVEMLTHAPGEYHASSIVGRRFNADTSECEYLIRNSWGDRCNYANYECQDGHIWVDQERLASFVREIDFIPRSE